MSEIKITPKNDFSDNTNIVEVYEDFDDSPLLDSLKELQVKYEQLKYKNYEDESEFKRTYRAKIPKYIWYLVWFLVFIFFIVLPLSALSEMNRSYWNFMDLFMNYFGALGSVVEPAAIALLAAIAGRIIGLLVKVFNKYINEDDLK